MVIIGGGELTSSASRCSGSTPRCHDDRWAKKAHRKLTRGELTEATRSCSPRARSGPSSSTSLWVTLFHAVPRCLTHPETDLASRDDVLRRKQVIPPRKVQIPGQLVLRRGGAHGNRSPQRSSPASSGRFQILMTFPM